MYISIDLGGTKTRIAASKDLITLSGLEKFATFKGLVDQKQAIQKVILKLAGTEPIIKMCVGIPGTIDRSQKKFGKVPNYTELEGVRFCDFLGEDTVYANDASLAGLAEAARGAGREFSNVAYITLSTGIGGVRIEEKKLTLTQGSYEPGHQVISFYSKHTDSAGIRGSAEALLGGSNFKKVYGEDPETCVNAKVWDQYAEHLSVLLVNTLSVWAPDIIVLGGSLTAKFDMFYAKTMQNLANYRFFTLPPVVKSQFGDDAGVYGGLELLSQLA